MFERHNFYRDIHKGIRCMLLDLVAKSGRVNFNDSAELDAFRATARDTFAMLEGHAEHENTFVAPLLDEHAPVIAGVIGGAHDDQEPRLELLLAALDAIDSAAPEARAKGHAWVVQFSRLAGELLVHMADEEELVLTALWKAVDDAALIDAHERLVRSIPPAEMGRTLALMLPAMNTPERVEMLAQMRSTAPAEVFGSVRKLAQSLLSAREDEALEQGLRNAALQVA